MVADKTGFPLPLMRSLINTRSDGVLHLMHRKIDSYAMAFIDFQMKKTLIAPESRFEFHNEPQYVHWRHPANNATLIARELLITDRLLSHAVGG
jgi:exopolysaccharide biosynthesis predicted pyruvyltransferase EpsI